MVVIPWRWLHIPAELKHTYRINDDDDHQLINLPTQSPVIGSIGGSGSGGGGGGAIGLILPVPVKCCIIVQVSDKILLCSGFDSEGKYWAACDGLVRYDGRSNDTTFVYRIDVGAVILRLFRAVYITVSLHNVAVEHDGCKYVIIIWFLLGNLILE